MNDPVVMAQAGKPVIKVISLQMPETQQVKRIGFMTGLVTVPDDFDRSGQAQIEQVFGGKSCG